MLNVFDERGPGPVLCEEIKEIRCAVQLPAHLILVGPPNARDRGPESRHGGSHRRTLTKEIPLRQIDDFATATIADYEASGSPVPAFDKHLSLFSQDIPLEFPEPLAPPPASSASASHHE
ncbi:hypothetical protein ZWY2020_013278 [Hordeum vulgare]|nr:hypothetical protein ZWY2020_013278 [Hordeum vulgare]